MFKKIISIVPIAVLAAGISAQASTITVEKGDTLWKLSQVHNISVANIQAMNHLSSDTIHPGDVLTIAQEKQQNQAKQYKVKKGDTLWKIANTHNISVSQLKEWNQLHTDVIHPGSTLAVSATGNTNTSNKAVAGATTNVPNPAPVEETAKKQLTVKATAYTATCKGCSGITATGINLKKNPNAKVISVDPSVIPLGSKVHVEGYGEAIAGDTGSAIKGNKIDVFMPSKQDAINFGVKQVKVTILD